MDVRSKHRTTPTPTPTFRIGAPVAPFRRSRRRGSRRSRGSGFKHQTATPLGRPWNRCRHVGHVAVSGSWTRPRFRPIALRRPMGHLIAGSPTPALPRPSPRPPLPPPRPTRPAAITSELAAERSSFIITARVASRPHTGTVAPSGPVTPPRPRPVLPPQFSRPPAAIERDAKAPRRNHPSFRRGELESDRAKERATLTRQQFDLVPPTRGIRVVCEREGTPA